VALRLAVVVVLTFGCVLLFLSVSVLVLVLGLVFKHDGVVVVFGEVACLLSCV
jgi:hypothetical protein